MSRIAETRDPTWLVHEPPRTLLERMQPQRWRQIDRVLGHALETAPERRSELLDRECAGDDDLRREVESLLSHDRPDSLLETGAAAEAARLVSARTPVGRRGPSPDLSGHRLGRFRVEARLGEGGMGEVWRARDPLLDRAVALKVIPLALRDDPHLKQRLRREALATSR